MMVPIKNVNFEDFRVFLGDPIFRTRITKSQFVGGKLPN